MRDQQMRLTGSYHGQSLEIVPELFVFDMEEVSEGKTDFAWVDVETLQENHENEAYYSHAFSAPV